MGSEYFSVTNSTQPHTQPQKRHSGSTAYYGPQQQQQQFGVSSRRSTAAEREDVDLNYRGHSREHTHLSQRRLHTFAALIETSNLIFVISKITERIFFQQGHISEKHTYVRDSRDQLWKHQGRVSAIKKLDVIQLSCIITEYFVTLFPKHPLIFWH